LPPNAAPTSQEDGEDGDDRVTASSCAVKVFSTTDPEPLESKRDRFGVRVSQAKPHTTHLVVEARHKRKRPKLKQFEERKALSSVGLMGPKPPKNLPTSPLGCNKLDQYIYPYNIVVCIWYTHSEPQKVNT